MTRYNGKFTYAEVYDYVLSNPLCYAKDLAERFDVGTNRMCKSLHHMEAYGYLRQRRDVEMDPERGKIRWEVGDKRPSRLHDPRLLKEREDALLALITHGEELTRKEMLETCSVQMTKDMFWRLMTGMRDRGLVEYHPNRKTWRVVRER